MGGFKAFLLKTNALALAIGVIIGAALDEVRGVTTMTRVLGSYPSPDA